MVLLSRAWINFIRQPLLVIARIVQSGSLGIIMAIFIAPLGDDQPRFVAAFAASSVCRADLCPAASSTESVSLSKLTRWRSLEC